MGRKESTVKKLLVKCEKELPCYVSCNLPLSGNTSPEPKKSRIRFQDSAYSWLVCFSASMSLVIALGLPYSYGVLFPVLLEEFKESKAKTAWVGSLNLSMPFLMGPFAAILCNRYGCRATSIFGALLTVLGLLATSQAPSILVMYFTYGLVSSSGVSCVYTACFIIVPRYFYIRRSLATSMLVTGPSLATLSFGPLLQILIECMGWRNTFVVMAAMTSVVCVLALSFNPNIDDEDGKLETEVTWDSLHTSEPEKASQWQVLRNKKFLIYSGFSIVVFFGIYNTSVHIVQFAMEKGISSDKASMLFFYFGLISTFARISSGVLLDFKLIDCPILSITAVFINGVAVLCLALTRNFSEILTIFLVLGLTDGGFACTANLLILNSVKPSQFAFAYGLWLCVISFSMALGPVTSGLIADVLQSYNPVFFVSGAVLLISTFILASSFLPCLKTGYESAKQEVHLPIWEEYTVTERVSVV